MFSPWVPLHLWVCITCCPHFPVWFFREPNFNKTPVVANGIRYNSPKHFLSEKLLVMSAAWLTPPLPERGTVTKLSRGHRAMQKGRKARTRLSPSGRHIGDACPRSPFYCDEYPVHQPLLQAATHPPGHDRPGVQVERRAGRPVRNCECRSRGSLLHTGLLPGPNDPSLCERPLLEIVQLSWYIPYPQTDGTGWL